MFYKVSMLEALR